MPLSENEKKEYLKEIKDHPRFNEISDFIEPDAILKINYRPKKIRDGKAHDSVINELAGNKERLEELNGLGFASNDLGQMLRGAGGNAGKAVVCLAGRIDEIETLKGLHFPLGNIAATLQGSGIKVGKHIQYLLAEENELSKFGKVPKKIVEYRKKIFDRKEDLAKKRGVSEERVTQELSAVPQAATKRQRTERPDDDRKPAAIGRTENNPASVTIPNNSEGNDLALQLVNLAPVNDAFDTISVDIPTGGGSLGSSQNSSRSILHQLAATIPTDDFGEVRVRTPPDAGSMASHNNSYAEFEPPQSKLRTSHNIPNVVTILTTAQPAVGPYTKKLNQQRQRDKSTRTK